MTFINFTYKTRVEEANGFDSEDYTKESFANLTARIEAAEDILRVTDATQEQMDEALINIQIAINDLEKPEKNIPMSNTHVITTTFLSNSGWLSHQKNLPKI